MPSAERVDAHVDAKRYSLRVHAHDGLAHMNQENCWTGKMKNIPQILIFTSSRKSSAAG